jgi:hypothetical protein
MPQFFIDELTCGSRKMLGDYKHSMKLQLSRNGFSGTGEVGDTR